MNLKSFLILSLFSVFAISCAKDQNIINSQYPNVDPELWSIYSTFEFEASKRGFDIDLNALNISGDIEEIHQENVAGSCKYGSHIDNEVTIDLSFWNNSTSLYKEFVVFHELGHCVLLRDHKESADHRGNCTSIMRSGLSGCRDNYTSQNRSTFIDELFYQD